MAKGERLSLAAVGFALAAAFSSWNPLAAPFGLMVGLSAAFLSARALQRGGRRGLAGAALLLSLLAAAESGIVMARTAGVGREPTGEPVVAGPTGEEAQRLLDEEAERTGAARERARDELGKVGGDPSPPPARKDSKPRR